MFKEEEDRYEEEPVDEEEERIRREKQFRLDIANYDSKHILHAFKNMIQTIIFVFTEKTASLYNFLAFVTFV